MVAIGGKSDMVNAVQVVVGIVVLGVGLRTGWDLLQALKDLRRIDRELQDLRKDSDRLRREIVRLSRRKEDWSPRLDPLWWGDDGGTPREKSHEEPADAK